MPAIVRSGRRQARAPSASASSGSSKAVGTPKKAKASQRSKGPSLKGKAALIGNVALPNVFIVGLVLSLVVLVMSAVLLSGGRAEALRLASIDFLNERIATFGIRLKSVRLQNLSDAASPDVKTALLRLNLYKGAPLALMDLEAVRQSVEKVGWVKSAVVLRQLPDVLIIDITERPRLAVWQYKQKTYVIDTEGQVIPEARAANFLDLPLVVGEGANEQAAEIVELLRLHPLIMPQLIAVVRMDTRRWDLRFKNGTLVKLPALQPDLALDRLDNLIKRNRILDQGLAIIDLRAPDLLVTPFAKLRPQ
jgi:cell division protein FtsQ